MAPDRRDSRRLIFATERYEYLQRNLAKAAGLQLGEIERQRFPDGERYLRVTSDVDGAHAVLVGGTIDDAATLELYDLASGLISCGVATLSLVVPYFGYSTQERAVSPGEVVTAKARAVLLSSIPAARVANEIVMLDLHTVGIAHYFEGSVHSRHLSAMPLVLGVVKKIAKKDDVVVACTDAGRAKWVQQLANEAGLPAAFVYKARRRGNTVVTGVNADVRDKHVIVYDDMVRSGGSLIQAGLAYQAAGAGKITAIATHGVLPGESLATIRAAGCFTALYCTDSHPRVGELAGTRDAAGFLQVLPIAPVLGAHFSEIAKRR